MQGGDIEKFPEGYVDVDDVLCSDEKSNYDLEFGEYEVPVKGRTGTKRSRASAHLQHGGAVRIDCAANPDFWVELCLPNDYILGQARHIKKKEEEREKRRKRYMELKKEFENE